jgi:hypothetical protein
MATFRIQVMGLILSTCLGLSSVACTGSEPLPPLPSRPLWTAKLPAYSISNLPNYSQADIEMAPRVEFCDLVWYPERFEGRLVRVGGRYSERFESSGLSSRRCPNAGSWVEFAPAVAERSRKEALDIFRRHYDERAVMLSGFVVDLEFVARFESAAVHYGHMGGSSSLLQVVVIESVRIPPEYQRVITAARAVPRRWQSAW